jgi:hypothetical protein
VSFESVARSAGVSRSWLYTQPDIRDEIRRLRDLGRRAPGTSVPARHRSSDASLLRRLEATTARNRELAQDNQRLRHQLAQALGQLRAAGIRQIVDRHDNVSGNATKCQCLPRWVLCRCREIRFFSGAGARQTLLGVPSRSYVICCVQRTGSWLLAHTLADTGYAGRPSDYFDEAERERHTREWGLPAGQLTPYVRALWDRATTPDGVLGSKLMWNNFDWLRSTLRPPAGTDAGLQFMRTTFPNPQFIWLRRADKGRQGNSWWRAAVTNQWALRPD